ncbi:MAG: hypothetical protein IPO67_06285 [Deltaproteobacteria bacterium]|nr:hypothetical protein [Deltaproteobacteria bacterium]
MRHPALLPVLFTLSAIGCDGKEAPTDTSTAATVTYYGDMEPVIVEKCGSCHAPGGVGPGDWTDPETAKTNAFVMNVYVQAGKMPYPAADPTCRDYEGSHRLHLTDAEKALFQAWVDADAPLGDEAERTPGLSVPDLSLDDTDITLTPFESHEVSVGEDRNEYWCVVLDNPLTETRYVTGLDVDIDNRQAVHHLLLAIDYGGDAGIEYGTDGKQRSFACPDPIVESDWMLLHAWAPGMEAVEFPEGVGLKVEPGQQLVLQYHYYDDDPSTPTGSDQSGYRLRTTDSVEVEAQMSAVGPTRFNITAGEPAYSAADKMRNEWGDITVYGVFPHMHLLGKSMRSWIGKSGEEDVCLIGGGYDFGAQMTYMFKEPAIWPQGSNLNVECTWDNSAESPYQYNDPPQNVTFGEGSDEEMCFALFYYAFAG